MAAAPPRTMTIEEFSGFEGDSPCDLIDGELVEAATSGLHGMIASSLAMAIGGFVREYCLGAVMIRPTTFVLSQERRTAVRPDVAFLRSDRVPAMPELNLDVPYAPDLAAEVISPYDRAGTMNAKLQAYLVAGTLLVWVVDPLKQTVLSYSLDGPVRFYGAADTLDGGEVLPGFALPLAELFEL